MFIRLDDRQYVTLRPRNSEIEETDWEVLSHFWYPIAALDDIAEQPVPVTLLDVDLVLYGQSQDEIAAAVDLCPHRHIRLSRGQVVDGDIECAFHGLRFDRAGRCTHVPAVGHRDNYPSTYRLRTFPTRIRYGLVWTCLGDPDRHEIPVFEGFGEDARDTAGYVRANLWPISAPRQIENFFDLAHLPFVHAKTLGGDVEVPLQPGRITHTTDAVTLTASCIEKPFGGAARPCTSSIGSAARWPG